MLDFWSINHYSEPDPESGWAYSDWERAAAIQDERTEMQQAGFIIDEEHGVYVRDGYGAFIQNVEGKIHSIEDLRNYYIDVLRKYPYRELVRHRDEEGYELVIGPPSPLYPEGRGVYCRNYREIFARERSGYSAPKKPKEEQEGR